MKSNAYSSLGHPCRQAHHSSALESFSRRLGASGGAAHGSTLNLQNAANPPPSDSSALHGYPAPQSMSGSGQPAEPANPSSDQEYSRVRSRFAPAARHPAYR